MSTEYLLGHHAREWDRLREQHALWREGLLRILAIKPGETALEVGCGSGALLADLAAAVGPTGRCVGLERDPAAAAQAQLAAAAAPWAGVLGGDLMTADLGGPYDAIVARWVFSFLPDPGPAAQRLAAALAPGGRLVVQDYDHDGIRLFPRAPAFERAVAAYRAAYAEAGGDLWVAGRLPGLMRRAGLTVTGVHPEVQAGAPGSAPWRWVERFLFEHLPTVSTDGEAEPARLSPAEQAALREAWEDAKADPDTLLVTPIQVTVVGRRV